MKWLLVIHVPVCAVVLVAARVRQDAPDSVSYAQAHVRGRVSEL